MSERPGKHYTGPETIVVQGRDGRQVRCPAHPAPCDYIRIVRPDPNPNVKPAELAYWHVDEWFSVDVELRESVETMGAIMGAIKEVADS